MMTMTSAFKRFFLATLVLFLCWAVAHAATVTWSHTLTTSLNTSTDNTRVLVDADDASTSGTWVRLKIQSATSGGMSIVGSSIGVRSGTTGNFGVTPTPVTWDGSNPGCTLSANETKYSDWIQYNFDETVDHLVHLTYNYGTAYIKIATGSATKHCWYGDYDYDYSSATNWPGGAGSGDQDYVRVLTAVEVQSGEFQVAGVPSPAQVGGVSSPAAVAGIPTGGVIEAYMAAPTASCGESAGTKTITVNLSAQSPNTTYVYWAAAGTNSYDGAQCTATDARNPQGYGSGNDFSPASGMLTFAPSDTQEDITLTIHDNTAAEPDQKLVVTLTSATGATIREEQKTTQLEIADNDRSCAVLDMTDLPVTFPLEGGSGWGGPSWNLSSADAGTNNRNHFQSVLDYVKTYHAGEAFVLYIPTDLSPYLIDCDNDGPYGKIKVPSQVKLTITGGGADGRDYPGTEQTVLKAVAPYGDSTRIFDNSVTGYIYNSSSDSGTNRLLIKNLVLDGDCQNLDGNWWDLGTVERQEHSWPLFISGYQVNTGRFQWAAEKIKIINSPSSGLQSWRMADARIWQYDSEECYKGAFVLSGGATNTYAYEIKSGGTLWGGGIWCESEPGGDPVQYGGDGTYSTYSFTNVYGGDWVINNGRLFYISIKSGGEIVLDDVHFYENTTDYTGYTSKGSQLGSNVVLAQWRDNDFYPGTNSVTISNSDLWLACGSEYRAGGPFTYNYVNIYSYYHVNDSGSIVNNGISGMPAFPNRAGSGPNDYEVNYDHCNFYHSGANQSGYPNVAQAVESNSGYSWVSAPNAYFRFYHCFFDSTVDSVMRQRPYCLAHAYNEGTIPVWTFDNCVFDNTSARGYYAFEPARWDDAGYDNAFLSIINPTYTSGALTKIYKFNAGTGGQTWSWLLHSGSLTAAQNLNSISGSNLTTISVANAEGSADIASIVTGADTTINTETAHGLSVDDDIMFDGFSEAGNNDWFSSLSPHTLVPLFTVKSVIDSDSFTIELDTSSGYAAYVPSADMARVSKYPYRTIVGSPGDNPVTSKPAGMVGDRYNANGTYYRCRTSGVNGASSWVAE